MMCEVLSVSESGYYICLKNKDKPSKRELLSVEVKRIVDENPENRNYGVERITLALGQRGITVSQRTVYRIMRELGLTHKKRVPHGITKASKEEQDQENLLKRDFTASAPGEKVLSDITEIACADGKIYLSAILDCFNGEIIGMSIQDNMKKELCIDTVKDMLGRFPSYRGAIFHSDRGSQYTSKEFREMLSRNGFIQSFSGTGHCFDNARMESFFATLKKEKIYQIPTYKMKKEEVKSVVFRYIAYYNRKRIYTGNPGGLPPAKYREKVSGTKVA